MISLERYAQLRAEMEDGASRDDVLRREGLQPSQWTAVQRKWLRALAAELEQGQRALSEQYCAAFFGASAGAPPHAQPPPLQPDSGAVSPSATVEPPSPLPLAAQVSPPPTATPSPPAAAVPLVAAPPSQPASPPPEPAKAEPTPGAAGELDLDRTAIGTAVRLNSTMPFATGGPSPALPKPSAGDTAPHPEVGATQAVSPETIAALRRAATPFATSAKAAKPAAPVDETVLGVPVVAEEPLPFRPGDSAPTPPVAAAPEQAAHPGVGETQEVTSEVIASMQRATLPFAKAAPPVDKTSALGESNFRVPVLVVPDSESGAEGQQPRPPPPSPIAASARVPRAEPAATTGTLAIEPPSSSEPVVAAPAASQRPAAQAPGASGPGLIPAADPAPSTEPVATSSTGAPCRELTIEQYALLCAQLAEQPEQPDQVLERHGLASDAELRQVHQVWAKRLETEPKLRRRFDSLRALYRRL